MRFSDGLPGCPSRRPRRGYALMLVVVVTLLVVTSAAIALAVARESTQAATNEARGASAHAVATTGIQWALTNLSSTGGKAAVVQAAVAAAGTATSVSPGPVNVYPFNADGQYAGIPTAPPAVGTSTANWTAFDDGHYGLLAAVDTLDPTRSVLIRVIGVVGTAQSVLETNLQLTPTQNLPAGMTGCFPAGFQITFYDQEGPYDYVGNFRIDGTLGVPLAMSSDHDRINGLARLGTSSTPAFDATVYPRGVKWRGQQNLRAACNTTNQTCAPSANRVQNIYGGSRIAQNGFAANFIHDSAAPFSGWEKNAYLSNDPRLVDVLELANMRGLGLGRGGALYTGRAVSALITGASVSRTRGLPLIAFNDAPSVFTDSPTGCTAGTDCDVLLGEAEWAGQRDDQARKGFYACDNHSAGAPRNESVNVCLVGKPTDGGTTEPDWTDSAVNHSGRAWGFLQSVMRQCTGSGDSINRRDGSPWWHPTTNANGIRCANGFEWLENIAACLIVPRAAARIAARGTNSLRDDNPATGTPTPAEFSDGNADNNFAGCHPGCLLAANLDGDGAAPDPQGDDSTTAQPDDDDRPFRSVCLNLDSTRLAYYGPGMLTTRLEATSGTPSTSFWATPVNGDGDAATGAAGAESNAAGAAQLWTEYNATTGVSADVADRTKGAVFMGADGIRRVGGAIVERGNIHLITRFDMGDRGPLGTCEQNCLAYGFGKDRTYGAHRNGTVTHGTPVLPSPVDNTGSSNVTLGTLSKAATSTDSNCVAEVPQNVSAGTPVVQACNWDSNYDGKLDRYSYALNSAYREECVAQRDGVAWSPAFNISSENSSITGTTACLNDLPGMHPDTAPLPIAPFCENGAEEDLRADIDRIIAVAQPVNASELNKTGALTNGAGWWGGAKCHMGSGTTFGGIGHTAHAGNLADLSNSDVDALGRPDYWIEDTCPQPVVVRVDSSASLNIGHVCGCGVLIMPSQSISIAANSHFLWRGIVIWDMKTAGKELKIDGNGASTFVIDGGMLMTGTNGMEIKISKKVSNASTISNAVDGTVKQFYRFNQAAVNDAFKAVPLPVRAIRRLR
jgi:hypothetical protein